MLMLKIYIGYRIIHIVLYLNTVLSSYSASTHPNLKKRLKRKLDESNFEVCKATRYIRNITAPNEYFQKKVTKMMVNEKCINIEENEKITVGVEDKASLVSNNPRTYNDVFNHVENERSDLVNSQAKIIDGKPSNAPDEVNTILDWEEMCWKNLLVTTGQKKIRHHYKRLMQQELDKVSVYSYSNSMFLNNFLKFPSLIFTSDSIRVRFGSGFLNFLSTDQLIRVLATLLSSDLELTSAERTELVETIFGHVDFSLDMNFNNDQIISIVTVLLRSDVPHCFEQVFLTWKMWKVFTIEEQEKMLEGVINEMEYKQETLVMLYLFVLNRDATNSSKCEVFKRHIIEIYGGPMISNDGENLTYLEYIEGNLIDSDTLGTSLLELPNILKILNNIDLIKFKKFIKSRVGSKKCWSHFIYFGKRYKIHICYALTKFTSENAQRNKKGAVSAYDKVCFKPEYITYVLNKWTKISKNNSSVVDERNVNEFRNAYGAMRQLVQNDGYDSVAFFRLFRMICVTNSLARLFTLMLFSLTKEDILRNVNKTPKWSAKYRKNKSESHHKFPYIEDIFMYNANLKFKTLKTYHPECYVKRITDILDSLYNRNKNLYRESYLYQQLLFHPKFKIFNGYRLKEYISSLNEIGKLDNKERRTQIARDLIFNEYYHESAVGLKLELIGTTGNLEEFRTCLVEECNRYENETTIENERETLKNC